MNSFERDVLGNPPITVNIPNLTNKIAEYRGKQTLYERQIPQVLDTLRYHAIIQSTESSNRIEGITVSSRRFDSIMKEKSQPKDRSEADIAGYRDVLRTIHERETRDGLKTQNKAALLIYNAALPLPLNLPLRLTTDPSDEIVTMAGIGGKDRLKPIDIRGIIRLNAIRHSH